MARRASRAPDRCVHRRTRSTVAVVTGLNPSTRASAGAPPAARPPRRPRRSARPRAPRQLLDRGGASFRAAASRCASSVSSSTPRVTSAIVAREPPARVDRDDDVRRPVRGEGRPLVQHLPGAAAAARRRAPGPARTRSALRIGSSARPRHVPVLEHAHLGHAELARELRVPQEVVQRAVHGHERARPHQSRSCAAARRGARGRSRAPRGPTTTLRSSTPRRSRSLITRITSGSLPGMTRLDITTTSPAARSNAGCSPRARRASAAASSPCVPGRDAEDRARAAARARGRRARPGRSATRGTARPRAPPVDRAVDRAPRARACARCVRAARACARDGARCPRACAGGARSTRTRPTTTACFASATIASSACAHALARRPSALARRCSSSR